MSVEAGQEAGGIVGREAVHRLRFVGGMGGALQVGPEHPRHYLGSHEEKAAPPLPPQRLAPSALRLPETLPLRDP